MKVASLLCMLVLSVSASMGQDAPLMAVPSLKEVPVTHIELTCEKGFELMSLSKTGTIGWGSSGGVISATPVVGTISGYYIPYSVCVSEKFLADLEKASAELNNKDSK